MATYYPTSSNQQRDVLANPYLTNLRLDSYHELPRFHDNMIYPNQDSADASYSELLSGSSLSPHNCVEVPNVGGRDEVVFIPPMGDPVGGSFIRDPPMLDFLDDEQNFQNQELSLSLGVQIPSHLPSIQYHHSHSSPYLVHSHPEDSGQLASESGESRTGEFFSFGGTDKSTKVGDFYNLQSLKQMQYSPHIYEASRLAYAISNSKYLKIAQELLDEVVSIHETLKQPKADHHHTFHKFGLNRGEGTNLKTCDSVLPSKNGMSSDAGESTTNYSGKLSPAERQELHSKLAKLFSLLEEVNTRYKQYRHETRNVESSFDVVAGHGAAKRYTELALQTISCHFRCLRDAINMQIKVIRQRLGEHNDSPNSQVLPRLRYVDKHLRQRRTLQQLGITQHSWRPQKGLPETAVTVLRAWLFEHFLHPYPKDSEKSMLAKKTGLTRSQVANWFINARVRLWKPMVEDIYKEEFGDSEADTGTELKESIFSATNIEINEHTRLDVKNNYLGEDGNYCGTFHVEHRPNVDKDRVCSEKYITNNYNVEGSPKSVSAKYDTSDFGEFAVGNQISLFALQC